MNKQAFTVEFSINGRTFTEGFRAYYLAENAALKLRNDPDFRSAIVRDASGVEIYGIRVI